jgi:hypothetical protein
MSLVVKGFGRRPRRTVPRTRAAGVRKPPKEETARWAGRPGPEKLARLTLWPGYAISLASVALFIIAGFLSNLR